MHKHMCFLRIYLYTQIEYEIKLLFIRGIYLLMLIRIDAK